MLRRHGVDKVTVVDVARAAGISHPAVYQHFASKAALQEAVAERWLSAISAPMAAIAEGGAPPSARLSTWFRALSELKRARRRDDPELFEAYHRLAEQHRAVVTAHVAALHAQVARIITDGAATGEFRTDDPTAAARAALDAMLRFHHPAFVTEDDDATHAARRDRVLALTLAGLAAPRP